jgi:hypothetical protein
MCKDFFKGLMGGGSAETQRSAASPETIVKSDTAGDVMGTELVDTLDMGRDPSGRVKLGQAPKSKGAAVGLSL